MTQKWYQDEWERVDLRRLSLMNWWRNWVWRRCFAAEHARYYWNGSSPDRDTQTPEEMAATIERLSDENERAVAATDLEKPFTP